MKKQIQKSGKYSTQIQAETLIQIAGIDEKRAREVYAEMFEIAKSTWAIEAIEIANLRIKELETRFMKRIMQLEKSLDMFKDPGFQFFLLEAQKSAASSSRDSDIDIIVEMLAKRFNGDDRKESRVLLSRAIEVIGQVSDESLQALTVLTALFVGSGIAIPKDVYVWNLYDEFDYYDRFFEQLSATSLPSIDFGWDFELELLDLMRTGSKGDYLFLYTDLMLDRYKEVITVGLKKESEEHLRASKQLNEMGITEVSIIEHELNDGYVRLGINKSDYLSEMNLSNAQLNCVQEILLSYVKALSTV